MRKIEEWKKYFWPGLFFLCYGCEFNSNQNSEPGLPLGLFKTQSRVLVSKIDSLGFQINRIDTASFFVRIEENGKWEQFEMVEDTCVYRRLLSQYTLMGDTVLLTKNHGINYKIESNKCQEIYSEYDRDTTFKVAIKGYSNDHIEIVGEELYSEKVFRYLKVNDSIQIRN